MKQNIFYVLAAALCAALVCAGCGKSNINPDKTTISDSNTTENSKSEGESGAVPTRVKGWLNWRGPHQNGVSDETGLPADLVVEGAKKNLLWTRDIAGRGHPVIANGRVYAWG